MNPLQLIHRKFFDTIGVLGLLLGYLIGIQALNSPNVAVRNLIIDAGFVIGLLVISLYLTSTARGRWMRLIAILAGALGITVLYKINQPTLASWMLSIGLYGLLTWLDQVIAPILCQSRPLRWTARFLLALTGGLLPVAFSQIESRFSNEEFHAATQGLLLTGFCFLFLTGYAYLNRHRETLQYSSPQTNKEGLIIAGSFAAVTAGIAVWSLFHYQHSFYTLDVPQYPGLTGASPFLCGEVSPDPRRPTGRAVFRQLVAEVKANPNRGVPELGMLALATKERHWAEAFRDAILAEAQTGVFTESTGLIKSIQHEAALRAYYAPRVRSAFLNLFSTSEWETLLNWFASINRRALTVEPVDWLYALAFSKWPEGPYENQEHGAGLLAILEAENLSPPDLSPVNRAYLERNRRGWSQRFHNTDDSYYYQPEWITNAYFQSLFWQAEANFEPNLTNRQLSFEWLLLQALPDGAPLRYNHVYGPLRAGTAYLAANLEEDSRFIWWTARMLDWASVNTARLWAQPGAENALTLQGTSPSAGSCLIYSNSGLPNQPGPLAPDKIVLRDGWAPDAKYMLLNLRFSGWHRYKATNNIIQLYQGGPIVVEKGHGSTFEWLPAGRQLFRDKRIPRENLNGLLIPGSGWSEVVRRLTGIGSPWAQDPPAYAQVASIDWLGPVDVSRTNIDDWRSWKHSRTVYFIHDGPVIVVDSARGRGRAAITWHLVGTGRRKQNKLWLRDTPTPVQMTIPPEAWRYTQVRPSETALESDGLDTPDWDIVYTPPEPGQLNLTTVFGTGKWASARYRLRELAGGQTVSAIGEDASLRLLQNDSSQWLRGATLATDGRWVLIMEQDNESTLCLAGGTHVQVDLQEEPASIQDAQGNAWRDWHWSDGLLSLDIPTPDKTACLTVVMH